MHLRALNLIPSLLPVQYGDWELDYKYCSLVVLWKVKSECLSSSLLRMYFPSSPAQTICALFAMQSLSFAVFVGVMIIRYGTTCSTR